IEQVRRFVRGGGGERVWVRPAESAEAVGGYVRDLGEQGLRARFDGRHARAGQNVVLLIELDDDSVEVAATVQDSRIDDEVEVVFVFEPPEPQAQAIRRHVLRRQVLARAFGPGVDDAR
ncbi:MAG TPA: PilZ domain-containing protein, partial [Catenuloplanes sp.]